jgi:hypothetical protein
MSLSCYDNMMIEDDNIEVGPSFKRMKLSAQSNFPNQIVLNNVQDPLEKLKNIFPYMQEDVSLY